MPKVSAPSLFLLGKRDQMTLAKAAQPLIGKAANGKVVMIDAGHRVFVRMES